MNIHMKSYDYTKKESNSASIAKSSNGNTVAQANNAKEEQVHTTVQSLQIEDSLQIGSEVPVKEATYKFDAKTIATLKSEVAANNESFKEMVRNMLEKQGLNVESILKRLDQGEAVNVEIDDETRALAKESISEDGFWGVKATSKRILDFAKAISNNDPSKIEMLKDYFKKGFEEVKTYFEGKLPDISQQTYDAVMKGFDEWENGGSDQKSDTENSETNL